MDNKIMRMSSRVYQEHNNKLSNRVLKKKKEGIVFLLHMSPQDALSQLAHKKKEKKTMAK